MRNLSHAVSWTVVSHDRSTSEWQQRLMVMDLLQQEDWEEKLQEIIDEGRSLEVLTALKQVAWRDLVVITIVVAIIKHHRPVEIWLGSFQTSRPVVPNGYTQPYLTHGMNSL